LSPGGLGLMQFGYVQTRRGLVQVNQGMGMGGQMGGMGM